jgi:hypothetical protein
MSAFAKHLNKEIDSFMGKKKTDKKSKSKGHKVCILLFRTIV